MAIITTIQGANRMNIDDETAKMFHYQLEQLQAQYENAVNEAEKNRKDEHLFMFYHTMQARIDGKIRVFQWLLRIGDL